MKISRAWLQTFFDQPLPDTAALSDALTFHAFEIDGVDRVGDDDVLDVKVTPNRGHDALSHRGIAKELAAILKLSLKNDPLNNPPTLEPVNKNISISLQNLDLCKRYIVGYIRGVEVKESPQWLKTSLEALGQRSINNIVDATNYVMFNVGQPLHAFDAGKLQEKDGTYALAVRTAGQGEKLLALDEKEYELGNSMLVIADAHANKAIGIAGVKGGMPAGITRETKDIILESANFDGVSVRKTAQALRLRTDASARFEQGISPELAGYGMQAVVELIQQIAGGEVVEFVDRYPKPQSSNEVSVSVSKVTEVLGDTFGEREIKDSFDRLGFAYTQNGEVFTVVPPFERLDIQISEDLIEEVGRIQGYDRVPPMQLPMSVTDIQVNQNFAAAEAVREELAAQGYSEVFTSIFADKGERVVLNKVDGVRPYLRQSLILGLQDALKKNIPNKDMLGLKEVKLFEIGVVWKDGKEVMMLGTVAEKQPATEKPLIAEGAAVQDTLPFSQTQQYKPFSKFPYIVRDVAFWTPTGTSEQQVAELITKEAGELCVKVALFDTFTKGDKTSYAFRLIFQSFEKTLTDEEVLGVMEHVYASLKEKGFEIR